MPAARSGRVGGDYSQPDGERGLISLIDNAEGDNGWCLALVGRMANALLCHSVVWKISGIAVAGAINRCAWQPALFFRLSTASPCGELLVEWLEELQDVTHLSILAHVLAISRMHYWRGSGLSTFSVTQSSRG